MVKTSQNVPKCDIIGIGQSPTLLCCRIPPYEMPLIGSCYREATDIGTTWALEEASANQI